MSSLYQCRGRIYSTAILHKCSSIHFFFLGLFSYIFYTIRKEKANHLPEKDPDEYKDRITYVDCIIKNKTVALHRCEQNLWHYISLQASSPCISISHFIKNVSGIYEIKPKYLSINKPVVLSTLSTAKTSV
jgi:hypothetical protein